MANVLVTGANSFLGSRLSRALAAQGWTVHGFCRRPQQTLSIHWIAGDIRNAGAIAEAMGAVKPDWVFHLAADTRRARDTGLLTEMLQTNVVGTMNLIAAARTTSPKALVAVGSFEEYGDQEPPFHENLAPRPVSPYGLTKALASVLITGVGREVVPAAVIRLPVPYGPGQTPDLFVGGACAALKAGKRFPMSKGEQTRDFLYVDDGIAALLLAAEHIGICRGEILNACSGVAVPLHEAIQTIAQVAGVKDFADIGALPYRPHEQMRYLGDPRKIQKLLGWSAQTSFPEGIRRSLAES